MTGTAFPCLLGKGFQELSEGNIRNGNQIIQWMLSEPNEEEIKQRKPMMTRRCWLSWRRLMGSVRSMMRMKIEPVNNAMLSVVGECRYSKICD